MSRNLRADFHGVAVYSQIFLLCVLSHTPTHREKEARHSQISSLEEEGMNVHCTALKLFSAYKFS